MSDLSTASQIALATLGQVASAGENLVPVGGGPGPRLRRRSRSTRPAADP